MWRVSAKDREKTCVTEGFSPLPLGESLRNKYMSAQPVKVQGWAYYRTERHELIAVLYPISPLTSWTISSRPILEGS